MIELHQRCVLQRAQADENAPPGAEYRDEDLFIAWLQSGPNAVVSHESALAVYDLSDALPTETHVIIPRTASRRQKGICHHTNRLESDEITWREGLPVTTVARTICDVASAGLPDEQVRQAIKEAITRGMVTPDELSKQAERRKGRMRHIIEETLEGVKRR